MNGIKGKKPSGRQWNRLLYTVVKIIKYKKITIDHDIYIKVLYDGTVSYLTVSNDDILNTTNNETVFTEIKQGFEEHFHMKVQEGSVLKYLNLRICHYPLGFSVDHTDHIMKLVNEWFSTEKFKKVDKTFRIDSTYEKGLMFAMELTGNTLHKTELEHHGELGHNLGRIKHIYLMSRFNICYETCSLATQTVSPILPGFQGTNSRVCL